PGSDDDVPTPALGRLGHRAPGGPVASESEAVPVVRGEVVEQEWADLQVLVDLALVGGRLEVAADLRLDLGRQAEVVAPVDDAVGAQGARACGATLVDRRRDPATTVIRAEDGSRAAWSPLDHL